VALAVAAGLVLLAPRPQPAEALTLGSGFTSRGVPTTGKTLFGAIVQDLNKASAMETSYGAKLGVRRTYWNSSQVDSSVKHAKADLDAGRLPWMSYKVPQSWAKMASGAGDAWAKDLANKLGALPGPVWVAFVHEPENDSAPAADWKRMQQRLSPIMRAKSNIAFTTILMGYHQFFANNGKGTPGKTMADYWPGTQHVDVAGFDPYNWWGTKKSNGTTNTAWDELKVYYAKFKTWSQANGNVKWAVAETGYTHTAAQKDAAWLTRAYDDMKAYGGAALAYFDVDATSIGESSSWTWPLTTTPKKTAFKGVLKRANRLVG
jgi:hypothetical protein